MHIDKSLSVVILAGPGASTRWVANALRRHFTVTAVVVEEPVSRRVFMAKRLRRLGVSTVVGQLLFQAFAKVWLRREAAARITALKSAHALDDSPLPTTLIRNVPTVNCAQTRSLLQALSPDIVVVNGTRIIAADTLNSVKTPFINMHAGITPAYRGVHGAYWALVQRDAGRCGVTVHLVDNGIDTGDVLYQSTVAPEGADNFLTYPLLQIAAGIPLLIRAIVDVCSGNALPRTGTGASALWSHPTLAQYLRHRLSRGVR